MTTNDDTQAARTYHDGTKHPGGGLMNPYHSYNPALDPLPFKIYEGPPPIPLPLEPATPVPGRAGGMPALEAIAARPQFTDTLRVPTMATLTRILYFSAGLTKKITYPWGEMYFRAAACTGALYHIELYAVCGDLPGLEAGVYHFAPHNQSLIRLRTGDFRAALADAAGQETHLAHAPLALIATDIWWRNAVKYQAREYRHTFWDGGTLLSHTLAECAAHDLPAHLVLGFADSAVNDLLGLDTAQEAALALVGIGHASDAPPPAPEITPLKLTVRPISEGRMPFQPILDMHAASSLPDGKAAADWRAGRLPPIEPSGALIPLPVPTDLPPDPLEDVIVRRGSTRRFSGEPITFEQLSSLLRQSTQGLSADFLDPWGAALTMPYVIVNAVDGLAAGAYATHPAQAALELIRAGDFRAEAGRLALGQELAADAAANIYFLTNLDALLDAFGNRGYRAAQLEAALGGGRMYLAAYAQKFGASGLTFFDDEVTRFFSPHAAGKAVLFLLAVGKKARRV